MFINAVRHNINGQEHVFALDPPLECPTQPPQDDLGYDLPAVLARHLAPEEAQQELRRRLAHKLFVMAEVAPNPQTYARQLTELTHGNPVVRAEHPLPYMRNLW